MGRAGIRGRCFPFSLNRLYSEKLPNPAAEPGRSSQSWRVSEAPTQTPHSAAEGKLSPSCGHPPRSPDRQGWPVSPTDPGATCRDHSPAGWTSVSLNRLRCKTDMMRATFNHNFLSTCNLPGSSCQQWTGLEEPVLWWIRVGPCCEDKG